MTNDGCPFEHAVKPEHRADPYPFYAELPRVPTRLGDGRYVVRDFEQVMALLHDPRLSSAEHETEEQAHPDADAMARRASLLTLDPPEHDRLRRIMMRQFGPPARPERIADLEPTIVERCHALIDHFECGKPVDVVDAFAHRLPLSIICTLMGIPGEAEAKFAGWVTTIVEATGTPPLSEEAIEARRSLARFLTEMAMDRVGGDGDDMLTGLVNEDGPDGKLPERSVGAMATLLLIAGHETTVNLIANGILTLIARPDEAERLCGDPARAALVVEELLRLQPPVQFIGNRTAIADIVVAGVTIPVGSRVVLLLAGANRDENRFTYPDRFDPDRPTAGHLGFGSGIHSCFGAPLARLEGQIALRLFFERVVEPRIDGDVPYRPSPLLRGPRHLLVSFAAIRSQQVSGRPEHDT